MTVSPRDDLTALEGYHSPQLTVDDLAPNGPLARSQELVDHLNWALAGPLDYGIVARKAPTPSGG